MRRIMVAIAFALLVLLPTGRIAVAGGWAVVTLDHLPSQLVANQPMTIGFNVRQHGQTLVTGLQPMIAATRVGSSDTFTASAHDEGAIGHYAATLTFPNTGNWEWYIDAFGSRQPMPTLFVAASLTDLRTAPSAPLPAGTSAPWPSALLLGAGVINLMAAVVLVLGWQRIRSRWVIAPFLIAVMLGGCSLALASQSSQSASSAVKSSEDSESLVRQGRDLFVAKGCIVCHQNDRVQYSQEGFFQVKIGPDLTNRRLTSEFLHTWLKDPPKVKPGTQMPTLGLSDQEIDALAAFLTGEDEKGESR